MTSAFRQLLNRFAMLGFERQLALMDRLGPEPRWRLDLDSSRVVFSPERSYGLQLLGTRSDAAGTWKWAWDHDEPNLSPAALVAVKKVRQIGRKRMVPELIEGEYPLEPLDLDAHMLAIVAAGLAELPAYYRFAYEGGALYAGLEASDVVLGEPDPARLKQVIEEVTSRMDLDERTAVEGYLAARGVKSEGHSGVVAAHLPGGRTLTATFDGTGHVSALGL